MPVGTVQPVRQAPAQAIAGGADPVVFVSTAGIGPGGFDPRAFRPPADGAGGTG